MALGDSGVINLGQVAFIDKGTYNTSETYKKFNFTTTEDSCYLSLKDNNKGNPVTDTNYWRCLANGKTATEAAAKALTAATAANTATNNANTASVKATNAATDAAAKTTAVEAALLQLDNLIEYLQSLAGEGVDMLNIMETLRQSIVTDMQLAPSRMQITYPKEIRVGNPVAQKIIAKLFPAYLVQNVIYQQPRNGGNSIEVNPDGGIDVLGMGKSKVHVIPSNNTGIYQTIEINVVNPRIRKTSSGKARITASGKLRKS